MGLDGRLDSFTTAEIAVLTRALIVQDDMLELENTGMTEEQDEASKALTVEVLAEHQRRQGR